MPFFPWREMLIEPGPSRQLVLAHRAESDLVSCVSMWAARALTTGGGAILAAGEARREPIARQIQALGVDVEARVRSGRLAFLDPEAPERPRADAFRARLAASVASVRAACGDREADVRAWGETESLWAPARELGALWEPLLCDERSRILVSWKLGDDATGDIENAARRVMAELFSDALPGPALSHVLRRGALLLGGPPPTALLLPVEDWLRPGRPLPR